MRISIPVGESVLRTYFSWCVMVKLSTNHGPSFVTLKVSSPTWQDAVRRAENLALTRPNVLDAVAEKVDKIPS